MPMTHAEREELEKWIEICYAKALEMGLDPYPVHFEVVPDHVIYELGAYALPGRFSHWTFGRDYHRQKTMYEYGVSRIYELVFNTDPSQAFLLENNSMLSHKLVVAHVYGHSDFFKNNVYFEQTDRSMISKARLHAERIRQYEAEVGPGEVEQFLDAVMSIEEHLDLSSGVFREKTGEEYEAERHRTSAPEGEFDDIWHVVEPHREHLPKPRRIPEEPEKDLLLFIRDHGHELQPWQRDIIEIVRDEMLYFVPQIRTKIMNEGWASYWHEKLLENLPLTPDEHFEFRRMHSGVLSPGGKMQLNPYYVGFQVLKDIERRWNGELDPLGEDEENWIGMTTERPINQGLDKIFEVRAVDNDQGFLRKYLTKSLVKRLDLFTYKLEEVNGEHLWVVEDTDWRNVRDTLVGGMTNFGAPYLTVDDGDFEHRGELLLKHHYDGKSLDPDYTARCLRNIEMLWGRPAHIETVVDDEPTLITCDGQVITQQGL